MEEYKEAILYAIQELKDKRPLPPHLDYMVSVKDKLTLPKLALFIIPMEGLKKGKDAKAGMVFELDPTLNISRQIRALIEAVLRDRMYDIRDQLPEGTIK